MKTKSRGFGLSVTLVLVIFGTLTYFLSRDLVRSQHLEAFHLAIKRGDAPTVRAFLVENKDFAYENIGGLSVAELAIENQRPEVLKEVLDALPRCAPGREGLPMLFIAAWKGTPADIQEVIRWCPASKVTWRGETVVNWAIRSGRNENVQFLLTLLSSRSVMLGIRSGFLSATLSVARFVL